ncbi:carbamoyl phosphate synthase large subunit [Halobacillus karajensis]|uniref:Carbamoyl-phosphate synthase arginine-specific large chain n=1 Tax=Halobacillus karajensis TaxID=195088 RepID=A0A059NX59_9BACI|nr:carbamoyl phosphate synthase large subunit [Halobacillus karajensis]CDQ18640.1 Carbamoyl-phosphate synthase arginine-specific large chain [Halobacillus karajensis]CDQ23288.1 Carbamoyl-phosphate synthase arginine-specific large chain [Halobacillus karajensis]CDQ26770.1 Carbamoyl-phosphate synthase arginine-specific large chain [Halobacillus karajensis]
MSLKVIVIGSGPIMIGQAAEFDYSGTQGCLALKEEGCEVILVNNNPATIMTDHDIADTVYCEPLTVASLTKIIDLERPDALLAGLGGQTALNLAVELEKESVLQKYGVELLGTSVYSIQQGEDRELFRSLMNELSQPVPESEVITTLRQAKTFADQVGYPIISRPAYTLGGRGGGIVHSEAELEELISTGLKASPIHQVIVEKSIAGFKEIEYEIMRDQNGTCISVCNMENFDPVGVHTGDSIVVAPSQTLSDNDYQMLRTAAFTIVSELDVIGGCNVQFALDTESRQYYVIEVNPRVSRSSALASKATGYPIAKMATKVALGYSLDQLENPLTGHTYASFEPALDYVVVKFPRWPFDKFSEADRELGTKMRATGEVMAIDRTLEGAFQKAVQSLDTKIPTLDEPWGHLEKTTDLRYFAILHLLRKGESMETIQKQTKIDAFFLQVMKNIVDLEEKLREEPLDETLLRQVKVNGFSDKQVADLTGLSENEIKKKRKSFEVKRQFKLVDTCAAEFEAATNYVYSTFAGTNEVIPLQGEKKALILGSGPIRIGQGVEFDYSAVKAIQSLQKQGWTTIMVNNNPETVSTDYETADRLYFEPIQKEIISSIVHHEQVDLVFTQFGGQTAINLAEELEASGIPLAGVQTDVLDALEDRDKFYAALNERGIPYVSGSTCHTKKEALEAAEDYSFPILCRPSYVIGGQGMVIVKDLKELKKALQATDDRHYPIMLDPFIQGTEVEVDLVADGENCFLPEIIEHIEPGGVHSGDSMAIFPSTLFEEMKQTIHSYSREIVQHFDYKGIMNIQFLLSGEDVYVLEVNPRASRTVPIVSKVANVPLVDLAVRILAGDELNLQGIPKPEIQSTAVKYPVFSSYALTEVDHKLGPNMKSTGEGMCLGETVDEALRKVFSHLPNAQKIKDSCYIEGDTKLSTDLNFEDWVKIEEASIYVNDQSSESATKRRIQAIKNGLTVFTERATFEAYLQSLACEDFIPAPLPGNKREGVRS